jgi:pimeloyl-ACP methyl ester carboxylesterase
MMVHPNARGTQALRFRLRKFPRCHYVSFGGRTMPYFTRGEISLYYEEYGSGYPILLFAPGGMRSGIEFWKHSPFDPTVELAKDFRVIAMDQRNAGHSRAPVVASEGWKTYTADHLALLDYLGIRRCHLMGGCIGSSYCLGVIKAAPRRVSAAILQNPIGLSPKNRELFYGMFDTWADALRKERPELSKAAFRAFRERMYAGDFVFSVTRDFVRSCRTPLLILCGSDEYHPMEISKELAALAPNAELIESWKTPDVVQGTVRRVREFLKAHEAGNPSKNRNPGTRRLKGALTSDKGRGLSFAKIRRAAAKAARAPDER